MRTSLLRSLGFVALVLGVSGSYGCVADRPARNGVFNENVYLRKDFLVRSGGTDDQGKAQPDPGWILKATITDTSSPNPLGGLNMWPGLQSTGHLVRFRVTQDHLEMLDMRELSPTGSQGRIPEVLDAWQATNVDLKFRVNLDGEQTNFYEENQENPWQDRQWVKLNLAKNDFGDVAALGTGMPDLLNHCASVGESATTLVPNSVVVDEEHGYLHWKVQLTVPIRTDLPECIEAYGPMATPAFSMDRPNVTLELLYSMQRADPSPTYLPLVLDEKDPIRRKYGPITFTGISRDPESGQLSAREMAVRFDPTKPIVWYFDRNFPAEYKDTFLGPDGIKDQTNAIMEAAGVASRVDFRELDDERDLPDDARDALAGCKADPTNHDALANARKFGLAGADFCGRQFGDVRYSFLRWMSDKDMQEGYAGVTQFLIDPRSGQALGSSIVINDFAIKDYYVQRIDAFLQAVGASQGVNLADWKDPPSGPGCKDGDTIPIVPVVYQKDGNGKDTTVPDTSTASIAAVNAKSTLFQKMQQYLNRPAEKYGPLAPTAFIQGQDDDFFRAYYALLPYQVFADPSGNAFVTPEGGSGVYGPDGGMWKMLEQEAEFHKRMADIDHGLDPYQGVTGPDGLKNAAAFLDRVRDLTQNHQKLTYAKLRAHPYQKMDSPDAFSFEQVIARDARHCVDGHWETKDEWVQNLIHTYWTQVMWHEFGHSLGLEHNFMASVDRPNFPRYKDGAGREKYALFASSVMEYNAAPDRVFWHAGWAPYDKGALAFLYANTVKDDHKASSSVSGQSSPMSPWKDPLGFTPDGKETQFLFCDERHLAYTPFCRQGDMGTTPSEIIANQIVSYEWQYNWRNFRAYRKFWDNSRYADAPAGLMVDMRRFLSAWAFDWSSGELTDSLRRIGVTNPDPKGSDQLYYSQLTNKFNAEMSTANQLVAAFHKAIIQQGSGERPFATVYDRYFGDVTQQGIILDKLFAMQGFVGMWPTTNYDQNQAGAYIASYSGIGDASYRAIAEDVVDSMVGGQYNVYPYFRPLAVVQFAMDTHSPSFSGRIDVRDWVGGQTFSRLQDFLDYFRNLAVQNNYAADGCANGFAACQYDPRKHSDSHNEVVGPDKRTWIWAYIPDRNQYVAVLKDRNTASYVIVRSYTDDVVNQLDDGAYPGSAYGLELPMKYFLDAFNAYR